MRLLAFARKIGSVSDRAVLNHSGTRVRGPPQCAITYLVFGPTLGGWPVPVSAGSTTQTYRALSARACHIGKPSQKGRTWHYNTISACGGRLRWPDPSNEPLNFARQTHKSEFWHRPKATWRASARASTPRMQQRQAQRVLQAFGTPLASKGKKKPSHSPCIWCVA